MNLHQDQILDQYQHHSRAIDANRYQYNKFCHSRLRHEIDNENIQTHKLILAIILIPALGERIIALER
jgi:hypothetical protein